MRLAKPLAPGSTIGILGGGQLGRMLTLAAGQLGFKCHIFAPEDREPPWTGELDLVDAETGVHLEIDANEETRRAYTQAFDE